MNSDYGTLPFEMKGYSKPRIQGHVWAMLAIGVACLVIVYFTRNAP